MWRARSIFDLVVTVSDPERHDQTTQDPYQPMINFIRPEWV